MDVGEPLERRGGKFVMTSRASDSIEEAADVLANNDIGALPICDSAGRVAGMLSERNIFRALAAHGPATLENEGGKLMTRDVVVCDAQDTLAAVLERMSERRVWHLPVVEAGFLRDIISERDVVRGALHKVRSGMRALAEGVTSSTRVPIAPPGRGRVPRLARLSRGAEFRSDAFSPRGSCG